MSHKPRFRDWKTTNTRKRRNRRSHGQSKKSSGFRSRNCCDRWATVSRKKRRISDNRLTGIVLDALESALTRELTADDVIAQLDAAGATDARTMRETAERELAELQRQRLRIADAVQYGAGDLGELAKRDRDLVAAIDAAVSRIATAPPPPDRHAIAGALASGRAIAAILRGGDPNALAPVAVELGLGVVADLDAGTAVLRFREPYGFLG